MKVGDKVLTAYGQGEIVEVIPSMAGDKYVVRFTNIYGGFVDKASAESAYQMVFTADALTPINR